MSVSLASMEGCSAFGGQAMRVLVVSQKENISTTCCFDAKSKPNIEQLEHLSVDLQ